MQNVQSLMMIITSDTYPAKRNSNTQKNYISIMKMPTKWQFGIVVGLDQNNKFLYDSLNRDLKLKCSDDSRHMGHKTILALNGQLRILILNIL